MVLLRLFGLAENWPGRECRSKLGECGRAGRGRGEQTEASQHATLLAQFQLLGDREVTIVVGVVQVVEQATALRSVEALGLNVAGVDMLRSSRGPLVLEVNASPGIEGIEKASGVDIAGAMIEFLEARAKPGDTHTKGSG